MSPVLALSVALAVVAFGRAEGAALGPCAANSPDLNLCVRTVLQQLAPSLASGVPSIGAEGTDPLENLPNFKYSRPSRLAPFTVQTENNAVTGLTSVIVNDVQVDLTTNTIRVQASVPGELVASGIHHTEGEIMGVPLSGSGPYTVTLSGSAIDLTLQGHPVQAADGRAYLQLSSARVTLLPGTPRVQAGGFFSSFPPLEQAASVFTNSVAGQVIEELTPTLEKWLGQIALTRGQSVFSAVSYDDLFPGRTPSIFALYRALPGYYY